MSTIRTFSGVFIALAAAAVFATAALGAPAGSPEQKTAPKEALTAPRLSGLDTLKAQMNALQGGLENLRRLRDFFDQIDVAEDAIMARAKQLIGTLPQHENAGDAALRIAAIASLTLESGGLADVDVDNGYRLSPGAMGWDLGPEGAQVHTGFTPVAPEALKINDSAVAVSGSTALTDGITAVEKFEATLPNGLYRVMIVRDAANDEDPLENPFGGDINLNGAPIKGNAGVDRERVKLTSGGEKVVSNEEPEVRHTALGLGIEGWAIVEDGVLRVDFTDLPTGRAISAIIAEPFDLEKLELSPAVMETLAGLLGDIDPAAGPEQRNTQRVMQFSRAGSQTSRTNTSNDNNGAARGPSTSPRNGTPNSRTSFASTRGTNSSPSTPAAASTDPTPQTSNVPAFEDRQVLLKRSVSEGPDSEGMAVDLGPILDDASDSGVFMCLAEPCADTPPIAREPDLTAAAETLGDWLNNPENLPDNWEDLVDVLADREDGSEVAVVYEFEIGHDNWTDVELRFSTGSGLLIWLDGEYVFGVSEDNGFVDDLNFEYNVLLPDLAGGTHFLQILFEDHTGADGFAFELRGTPIGNEQLAASAVPEPGTLALFLAGLIGIGAIRRRN